MNNTYLHLTHNDSDAIGCALAFEWAMRVIDPCGEIITSFNSIGHQDEALFRELETNPSIKKVIISDISISEDSCKRLEEYCKKHKIEILGGFDHHKTNLLASRFDWWHVTIDKEKPEYVTEGVKIIPAIQIGACEVLYDYLTSMLDKYYKKEKRKTELADFYKEFHNNLFFSLEARDIITAISRYDTWVWQNYPGKRCFKSPLEKLLFEKEDLFAATSKFMGTKKVFDVICNAKTIDDLYNVVNYLDSIYLMLKDNERIAIDKYIKSAKILDIADPDTENEKLYKAAVIVANDMNCNAAASEINKRYPDVVDLVIYIIPHISQLAFRSNKIDVGELAVKMFGAENAGGHAGAAGARVPASVCTDFLYTYLTSSNSLGWRDKY